MFPFWLNYDIAPLLLSYMLMMLIRFHYESMSIFPLLSNVYLLMHARHSWLPSVGHGVGHVCMHWHIRSYVVWAVEAQS